MTVEGSKGDDFFFFFIIPSSDRQKTPVGPQDNQRSEQRDRKQNKKGKVEVKY